MASKQQLQATFHIATLMLITVMSLAAAQSLQLAYRRRLQSGINFQPGDNRIVLQCEQNSIAIANPRIWVERSDLARQPVRIVNNQGGEVTVVVNQDIEGLYSCSDNRGVTSTNTLKLVAYPEANLSIPSSYAFQEGRQATINCRVMPGKLSQYYSVTWWNDNSIIARSNPRSVLPGYHLHKNFSLTINDIQLSDSGTSYRCSVAINDPQIPGTTGDFFYNRNQLGNISVAVYDSPSIVIVLEPRVITVVGDNQPNTTFICEATRVSGCTTQISWVHNGKDTSKSTGQRFQAIITGTSERTVRSRLNATQLRGSDSGRIGCVAHCRVDVPGEEQPLLLTSFRNTTLSVLSGDFATIVSLTTDGDMFIRINFQDGYQILDQTRVLMKYTDESSTNSRNMTSEEAYVNTSRILLEVPRSRLPYERFRVDVALQVEGEVGPFVSDGRVHDITERRTRIIVGAVVGGVITIAALAALVMCFVCVIAKCSNLKVKLKAEQTRQIEIQQRGERERVEMQEIGETFRAMINVGMSREEREELLPLLREILEYVKEKATSRMATDGDDEKQSFIAFLDEMQIPY